MDQIELYNKAKKKEQVEDFSEGLEFTRPCANGCGHAILFFSFNTENEYAESPEGRLCLTCKAAPLKHTVRQ